MNYSLSAAILLLAFSFLPTTTLGFSVPSLFGVKQQPPRSFVSSTPRDYAASGGGDECSLRDDDDNHDINDCLSLTGYTPSTKSFQIVTEVFVAQVESLRDRFESYEMNGVPKKNRIKFNKRRTKGQHILANSTVLENRSDDDDTGDDDDDDYEDNYDPAKEMQKDHSSEEQQSSSGSSRQSGGGNVRSHTYSVANLEYNELIADDEVVLIDTVRRPGIGSISRAFPRAGPRKQLHFEPSQVKAAIVTVRCDLCFLFVAFLFF